jgi:hypothetical protein
MRYDQNICRMGAELFHADMTKQTVALYTFVKVPKNLSSGLGIDTTRS